MEIDMDLEDVYYQYKTDNKILITNIEQLNSKPVENEYLRAVKFFQLMNNDNTETPEMISIKNKTQSINSLLLASAEKMDNLMGFLKSVIYEKNDIFNLKVLPQEVKYDKNELIKINYLKKRDSFDKALENFKKKLNVINEENRISQNIFNEMILLKELGFSIDENYKLDLKKVDIALSHKFFKTFDDLINIQKFMFNLTYKNKKFELNNNFYENFKKKYHLNFDLILKIDGSEHNICLNSILDDLILNSLPVIEGDRFKINNYLVFFIKYMFYIIVKKEVRSIIDHSHIFTYKNFNYIIKEFGKEYTLTLSNYNMYEISLIVRKDRISDLEGHKNNSISKLWTEISYNEDIFLMSDEEKKESDFMHKYNDILKMFINNILYDLRQYRFIKDFRISMGKDIKSSIDSSIVLKNIQRISSSIVRNLIIDKLNSILSHKDIAFYYSTTFTYYFHTYKYSIIKYGINTKKIEFTLIFNIKTNQFAIETKHNVNNTVNVFERETIVKEKEFEIAVNFKYIYSAIDNLINYN